MLGALAPSLEGRRALTKWPFILRGSLRSHLGDGVRLNKKYADEQKKLSVAVVGAGMGGLAVAATLRRAGIDVAVYEQASRFARIGAGIQMMPNSMKVLRGIGVEDRLRSVAFAPFSHLNRDGTTGEVTRELPMPESLYGAPYLCMHRADLHDALASAVPGEIIHLNKKLVGLEQKSGQVTLRFEDGTSASCRRRGRR